MTTYYTDQGPIKLDQQHYKAKGGQKSVFGKNGRGYAVYHEVNGMMPIDKINELSVLNRPEIIKPEPPILYLDKSKKKPIGHTFAWIDNVEPLVRLFPTVFQKKNGITPEMMIQLTVNLRDIVSYVHSKKIQIVDLNELNFLCDLTKWILYAIDVNSYQTPKHPATVIMPNIFDRHCKRDSSGFPVFDEATDWFSYAIIAFQMLIGMHPYKGNYAPMKNTPKKNQLDERMKQNISVFHSGVSLPAAARSFDLIPNALKQWMIVVFEQGERCPPPDNFESAMQVVRVTAKLLGSNLFEMTETMVFDEEIEDVLCHNTTKLVVLKNKIWSSVTRQEHPRPFSGELKVAFTDKSSRPVAAYIDNKNLHLFDLIGQREIPIVANADSIMHYDGRIYIRIGVIINELHLNEFGSKVLPSMKYVGQVVDAPNATKIYDGVIVQNIFGRHLCSFFPSFGQSYQIPLDEMDGYRIIDAKFDSVLMVVGEKNGNYTRFVFRFDKGFKNHDNRIIEDIDYTGLNFTVNDRGVCVAVVEEEKVEVFQSQINSPTIKEMEDPAIRGDMRLFHDGPNVFFYQGKKIYRMKMK
jgi:hypothetical protein